MSFNLSEESAPPLAERPDANSENGLIGVIHVSTTTVYFTIYTAKDFKELLSVCEEFQLLMPSNGWFEQDPVEIMTAVYQCCAEACAALPAKGYGPENMLCIAITNQRETTVMWNADTGRPLYRAIVWNDIRTAEIVDRFNKQLTPAEKKHLHQLSGLRLSPYFSALKIKWLQENVPEIRHAIRKGVCRAGTLDSWIVWNLTQGTTHVTDVTNASRTLLMNIQTLKWDDELLEIFQIDAKILPKIRSSSELFGRIKATGAAALKDVYIGGIIGDQQAALVGQTCLERCEANCTFDLGCFLLYNTGPQLIYSKNGLLSTVAYQMGPHAKPIYALEGSLAVGGRVFEWLSTKMRILPSFGEAESYASAVQSSAGVYFVPSFTGLYAPYWRKDARGIIIGLTAMHNAKHIVRAAHESICYQVCDVLDCMLKDCGVRVNKLRASGKLCQNNLLMQLQADIAGLPFSVSVRGDRATLGAAYCAARAFNFDLTAINANKAQVGEPFFKDFFPAITVEERQIGYDKWKRAVQRSIGWVEKKKPALKTKSPWTWSFIPFMVVVVTIGSFYVLRRKALKF